MTRSSTRALSLLVMIVALLASRATLGAPPATKADAPPPSALAEAKKKFEVGLKLYKEGLIKEALAAFMAADKIVPRASVERNIAQCQRDLKDFAAAFETYTALLDKFGPTLKPAESAEVKRAADELALLTGTIEVKSTETDAKVVVDERDLGPTPMVKPIRVNIGTHTVNVSKSGFEPFSKQVECRGNDQIVVEAKLEKEIFTGHLVVTGVGTTEGVMVSVDGREVGSLPWEGDLEPGSHQVSAQGPKSLAAPVRVEIARRQRTDVPLELQDQTGTLYVDPRNAEAEISIDGKVVGKGVWEGKVSADRHEVAIVAPQFRPYRRVLVVHVGERVVDSTPLQLEEGVNLHSFMGLYVGINLMGRFGVESPNSEFAERCPVQKGWCEIGKPLGAAGLLRIGYSFGWFGAEVMGFGSADHTSVDAEYQASLTQSMSTHYGPPRHESYNVNRFGAGGGLGIRATSKHSIIRFSGGAAFGVGYRSIDAQVDAQFVAPPSCPTCPANQDTRSWSSSATKTVPLLLFDGSLLLGSTPGTKFQLGVLATVEFYGDPLMSEGQGPDSVQGVQFGRPGVQVSHGTEVFIGPVLGLQFGE